jgi:hypothetical protein
MPVYYGMASIKAINFVPSTSFVNCPSLLFSNVKSRLPSLLFQTTESSMAKALLDSGPCRPTLPELAVTIAMHSAVPSCGAFCAAWGAAKGIDSFSVGARDRPPPLHLHGPFPGAEFWQIIGLQFLFLFFTFCPSTQLRSSPLSIPSLAFVLSRLAKLYTLARNCRRLLLSWMESLPLTAKRREKGTLAVF